MISKTISPCKIIEELGGVGIADKADDTRFRSLVAFKFLSPELSHNPEARGCFIREARATSALIHSNVGIIYDIQEHDG